jgi:hypothetical protein
MHTQIRTVKVMDLKGDPLAVDLAGSAAMRPYMNYYEAVVKNDHQAAEDATQQIKHLPLEQRYIWRIMSALKWGLCDFDSKTVKLDLPHLSDEERHEMVQDLEVCFIQLRTMLEALNCRD